MSTELLAKYWLNLHDRKAYMGAIAGRLDECAEKHSAVRVRLGADSKAGYPSFRLTYLEPGTDTETVYGSYYDSGTPIKDGSATKSGGHWGDAMGPGEIIRFLAGCLP